MATILVVDDDYAVRSVLCAILSRKGHAVVAAASGEQALEAYLTCRPVDLLLADVNMPFVSGPDLADRLWEQDRGLRVRSAILDRGLPLLTKPFLPRELLTRIEEVLRAPAPMLPARTKNADGC